MAELDMGRKLSRDERSRALKFNDKTLAKLDEYEYTPLRDQKRCIRLLLLLSSGLEDPVVDCKLFTVEFNDEYVPIRVHPPHLSAAALIGGGGGSGERRTPDPGESVSYEALSWCWGKESADYAIRIRDEDDVQYKLRAKRELVLALKYLRRPHRDRTIWIDAICIDQSNHLERNHQVQMMSMIYTRADKVCVWLGEDDSDSNMAITFITDDIMHLERFDSICKNKANADKWQALLTLMQRPWFRRRWVVQEIALARRAKVYCGEDKIPWKEFAVAVELFVEVESATHRLSEVMQKDERFFHVPLWFEYVSQLSASLLVDATGKVFRATETGKGNVKQESRQIRELDDGTVSQGTSSHRGADPSPTSSVKGRGKESTARGRIRDGPVELPSTGRPIQEGTGRSELSAGKVDSETKTGINEQKKARIPDTDDNTRCVTVDPLGRRGLLSLEYLVSTLSTFEATEPRDAIYSLLAIARDTTPFAEASAYRSYKSQATLDFISFCIERSDALDPSRALDILCRPWAPPPPKDDLEGVMGNITGKDKKRKLKKKLRSPSATFERMPTWKVAEKQGKGVYHEGTRVQLRASAKKEYSRRGENGELVPDERDMEKYWEDAVRDDISDFVLKYFPKQAEDGEDGEDADKPGQDIDLPSWVRSIEGAPFGPFKHPGMHFLKTGRMNADSLVGLPQDGHRNYSAAQTHKAEDRKFRLAFKKRPVLGHHSLYVKGFVLDRIAEVASPAHGGNIPRKWTALAGWERWETDPPDDFLRTLVADRGKGNRNPPYYYAKACRESVSKGSIESGRVNLEALIKSEQNSIIAEFCRRVQEVIWNRRLVKTERGTLGLASELVRPGDLVCIIYGCSVPVILRRFSKAAAKMEAAGATISTGRQRPQTTRTRARVGDKELNEDLGLFKIALSQLRQLERSGGMDGKQKPAEAANETDASAPKAMREVDGKSNGEEFSKALNAMDGVWLKLEERLKGQATDWFEDGRKRALEEALLQEVEEDKIEKAKASILAYEARLVQKARYKELCAKGFYNKATKYKGPDYQKYIKDATRIVNTHLGKMKKIEDNKIKAEAVAAKKLAIEAKTLKGKEEEDDSGEETVLDDRHFFYHHMGESYIHGMMDGEAIRERFRLKIPETVFELR